MLNEEEVGILRSEGFAFTTTRGRLRMLSRLDLHIKKLCSVFYSKA